MPPNYRGKKHEREVARATRRHAKLVKREARRKREAQFPSAWPDAPEPVAGVDRTLSRGL
jgi:hypothetical protein